jgi:hypothetical protein
MVESGAGTESGVVTSVSVHPKANRPRLNTTNNRENFFIEIGSTRNVIWFPQDLPAL